MFKTTNGQTMLIADIHEIQNYHLFVFINIKNWQQIQINTFGLA